MKTPVSHAFTKAISAAWRAQGHSINSDDWPGVVVSGDGWRVVLARKASSYVLQAFQSSHDRWGPLLAPASPAEWGDLFASRYPDLAQALVGLRADPSDAAADLAAVQGISISPMQRVRYWSTSAYSGVISTDANMRSVRDRTGRIYAIQWRSICDDEFQTEGPWITQVKGPLWSKLVDRLADKTAFPDDPDADLEQIKARFVALFHGCPDLAADGPWPVTD